MTNGLKLPDSLAFDSQALGNLRLKAHQDPAKTLPKVAKQFESIFVNMMLKAMRDTIPNDSLGNSQQTKLFTGLLDKQLAQSISQGHGLGLADVMIKQLSPHSTLPHAATTTLIRPLSLPQRGAAQVPYKPADKAMMRGTNTLTQDNHHE